MRKTAILLLLLMGVSGLQAQQKPDTLDYRNEYYFSHLQTQEQTPITRQDIVMLGNSITERGDWTAYFPKKKLCNRGIGGDCLAGIHARLNPITQGQPRAIFIMAGVNDLIFSTVSPDTLGRSYARLIDRIAKTSPRTRIYIQSILPLNTTAASDDFRKFFEGTPPRIEAMNALLRQLAAQLGVTYIDLWPKMADQGILRTAYTVDGIHLSAEGYRTWVEILKPHIQKL